MFRIVILLLLSTFASLAYAVDIQQRFGAWTVIRANDGIDLIATTANESGSFIGFRCFAKSQECAHVLFADIECTDGGSNPILINSDYSALSMNAFCSKNGANYELLLTPYDDIHRILQKGNDVGFAIPMASGQFKVVRFSLNGSEKAMEYVKEKTSRLGKRDSYL
ncbi:hypothetical protein [Alcanivorax jadensis]|uniref:hypothetical protein n=1 Tax=Alcanivorax jadensis TaxID=64988 RepID=UPI0026F2A5F6|nr:hypothetical protein [Alcanivorax jadensis]